MLGSGRRCECTEDGIGSLPRLVDAPVEQMLESPIEQTLESIGPMLRIGKLADYALLIVDCLAKQQGQLTTEAIASRINVPLATVRKLLKLLVDAGLLRSQRGLKGGYRLAREASRISVADVIMAVEGPPGLTQCAQDEQGCDLASDCELKDNWHFISDIIQQQLERITIADMGGDMRAAAARRIPAVSVTP